MAAAAAGSPLANADVHAFDEDAWERGIDRVNTPRDGELACRLLAGGQTLAQVQQRIAADLVLDEKKARVFVALAVHDICPAVPITSPKPSAPAPSTNQPVPAPAEREYYGDEPWPWGEELA